MMIHVHRGKGAKDRYVPLPQSTLQLLRRYWLTHRHPGLVFPALGRSGQGATQAQTPMAKSSVQGAFRRAKFDAGIAKKGVAIHTLRHFPSKVWQLDWNVDSQAVPSSQACLKYLAPYVFKVAISNSRILKVQDRTVLIRYRKPHSTRSRILPLEVMEFIRRFLQHVLPSGFMKVRYYGFMNPNCGVALDHIRSLIELTIGFQIDLPKAALQPSRPIICPNCGGRLKLRFLLSPAQVLLWSG